MDASTMHKLGGFSFLFGIIIALILGILNAASVVSAQIAGYLAAVLILLGIIVGFLNVETSEVPNFLLAGIALVVAGTAGSTLFLIMFTAAGLTTVGLYLSSILGYIVTFVVPGIIIVALKEIVDIARH